MYGYGWFKYPSLRNVDSSVLCIGVLLIFSLFMLRYCGCFNPSLLSSLLLYSGNYRDRKLLVNFLKNLFVKFVSKRTGFCNRAYECFSSDEYDSRRTEVGGFERASLEAVNEGTAG